jgi:hypothetical protein
MSSLIYTFSDLYNAVSKFIGTYGSAGPSGNNLSEAKEVVHDAYSRFIACNGSYRWSFLEQEDHLNTLAGDWVYQLPEGFETLTQVFQYENETGYRSPQERDASFIITLRGDQTECTAYPEFYAIRAGRYDPKYGQSKEVIFWPTPDTTYSFIYRYRFMPPKLENDADLPIGGPEFAFLLKQCCLAEAESGKDKKAGIQEQKLAAMMGLAVARDSARKPHILGHNGNGQSGLSLGRNPWQMPAIYPQTA